MQLVQKPLKFTDLEKMSHGFGNLVKAVIDVKLEIMAVEAELHADLESFLLQNGSNQEDLWGINLYPAFFGTADFVEFDSMINLRPWQNNLTRGVESKTNQERIKEIVNKLILK